MNKEISDNTLQEHIDNLPKSLAPERDLWRGIEKAISEQPVQGNDNRKVIYSGAWAAAVVMAVIVSWLSFTPEMGGSFKDANIAMVMEQDFAKQKQLMLTSLGQPDVTQLAPEMQTELKSLQDAQKAISTALKNDQNNGELLNLLRWTQKQELELLKQLYSPKWQTI